MDRTKARLATFFNDDDEEPAFPQKAVDAEKLNQYTQGTLKKSKREKEKEREEAKRREEEELAAKTYAEYVDAFEADGAQRKGRGFVRAGGDGSEYKPDSHAVSSSAAKAFDDAEDTRADSPPSQVSKPKGKRAMDDFLAEIKRDQAEREQRLNRNSRVQGRSVTALAAYEGQSGSKDRGDPLTSNVFVANLPANVSEPSLGNFFAQRCGPVGSVKVMWPRGDASQGPGADMTMSRSKKSTGLSGFVSFMKRKDAETAVREIDGFTWGGSVLRVGWSKAVPIAARPAYVAQTGSRSRSRSRSHSHSPARKRARSRSPYEHRSSRRSRSRSREDRGRYRAHSRSDSYERSSRRRDSRSPPAYSRTGVDPDMEKFIRTVALKVKENGEKFEDLLRERERQNPLFKFLFDVSTPENRLYRSVISGESLVAGFDDEGYNSVYSTDSAEESEREHVRKTKLGKLARRRFEAMLRALSGRQGEMARCMAFSLEHAEAAHEVSDVIVASLLVDGTPVPRKVARLHLICDILHNSAAAVPSAWKFRQEFQARLGIVFDHLSGIYHSFPGRITAETFKNQITAVVDIWEDWIVFPPEFTETLRSRLEGSTQAQEDTQDDSGGTNDKQSEGPAITSKFKTSAFKPTTTPVEMKPLKTTEDDDGEADMDLTDSDVEKPSKGEDVDDVDGEPIDDVDGEPIEDIDGEPLDGEPLDGEPFDVDGEPMADDDIDGVPM